MNCRRETVEMAVLPGNRPALPRDWIRGVPERYVAGSDTRGRPEERPYPWSQQATREISRLKRVHSGTGKTARTEKGSAQMSNLLQGDGHRGFAAITFVPGGVCKDRPPGGHPITGVSSLEG